MSDDLGFEAFDHLYFRPSLKDSPISVAIRNCKEDRFAEQIEAVTQLLSKRTQPDEVILVSDCEPAQRPPGRLGRFAIRVAVLQNATNASTLTWCLANARWPALVVLDPQISVTRSEFQAMVEALDRVDIVIGVRKRKGSWLANQWSRRIHHAFNVQTQDPFSPIKAFRTQAIQGIPLESSSVLAEFELLAKAAVFPSLFDEVPIKLDRSEDRDLMELVRSEPQFRQLLSSPKIWEGNAHRVPAQECGLFPREQVARNAWGGDCRKYRLMNLPGKKRNDRRPRPSVNQSLRGVPTKG